MQNAKILHGELNLKELLALVMVVRVTRCAPFPVSAACRGLPAPPDDGKWRWSMNVFVRMEQ
jgi:hypothetical protein